MTTIDIENSKQIRQPMDVIIQIAAAETATLTYSGYSAAKVADGELDEPDWPMRKLADLQGDGFLLDGSAVLYDSTVTASAANGKLGVRSVIGTAISVTVTSDVALQYLTVTASGAESVTYNGTAYSMTSGYALIPVGGGTTFTLTFTPAAADERVEISDIQPGALIKITNDNLISAVVSLRSDLSILEPTLPESEINIEAYFDEDISDILAAIPDETPVTYQAGYEGDMSPVRKFYLAEQIAWEDNVMSIHGVDAVHKLDIDFWPGTIGMIDDHDATISYLYMSLLYALSLAGVTFSRPDGFLSMDNLTTYSGKISVIPHSTVREWLARVMWLFHVDIPTGVIPGDAGYWPTYVDAGIPSIRWKKPTALWTILEEDCGDVNRQTARNISKLTIKHGETMLPETPFIWSTSFPNVGDCTLIKNVGASISFDDFVYGGYGFLFRSTSGSVLRPVTTQKGRNSVYTSELASLTTALNNQWSRQIAFGRALLVSGIPQGVFDALSATYQYYTQFVPWDTTMANAWDSLVSNEQQEVSAERVPGKKISVNEVYKDFDGASQGESVTLDDIVWYGEVNTNGIDSTAVTTVNVFPDLSIPSLLSRSPITGSFTWKGDPRMQPRDVAAFHRLDGTAEDITLENITITHEKGGTSAEITYRKGVC